MNSLKSGAGQLPPDNPYRAALCRLLIQQFMLHEVEHHNLQAVPGHDRVCLAPIAHGLIDIYKCLHQGEFGVGHTIDHPQGFAQRIYQEMMRDEISDTVREPAVESISSDGRMLRVNLRALRHFFAGDPAAAARDLATACLQSARITEGNDTRFLETLDLFRSINQAGDIALAGHVFIFPADLVDTFFFELRALMRRTGQIPVFSHSETYRRLNRPSYRVVERPVLQASPLEVLLEK